MKQRKHIRIITYLHIFEAVKQSVATRQAASFYGIRAGKNRMVCCPFYNNHMPSIKVDSRFYRFGCEAFGFSFNGRTVLQVLSFLFEVLL